MTSPEEFVEQIDDLIDGCIEGDGLDKAKTAALIRARDAEIRAAVIAEYSKRLTTHVYCHTNISECCVPRIMSRHFPDGGKP